MSKERLEEIEEAYHLSHKHIGAYVSSEGIEWLIKYAREQAERVQELEKDIKEWEIVNESWEEINTNLAEQNKRYREHFDWIIQNSTDKYAVQASYEALEGDLE